MPGSNIALLWLWLYSATNYAVWNPNRFDDGARGLATLAIMCHACHKRIGPKVV